MLDIKIHVFHVGEVCVSKYLPFGGENCNLIKASGIFGKKSDRVWLPISAYLIEHPKGKILVDCGWHREMSPNGKYDRKAQIKSLGSPILYLVNQGKIEKGASIDEQLLRMEIKPEDLEYVLLTHLDCDHVSGLQQVSDAKNILVSADEISYAKKHGFFRYKNKWWNGVNLTEFQWNEFEGPVKKSYDLFGDGSVSLVNIPGHSDGLFAVKVTDKEGKFVLLFSDGGYANKSWSEMIMPGISSDKEQQKKSLDWIRKQSLDINCIESIANHDNDVIPHTIIL